MTTQTWTPSESAPRFGCCFQRPEHPLSQHAADPNRPAQKPSGHGLSGTGAAAGWSPATRTMSFTLQMGGARGKWRNGGSREAFAWHSCNGAVFSAVIVWVPFSVGAASFWHRLISDARRPAPSFYHQTPSIARRFEPKETHGCLSQCVSTFGGVLLCVICSMFIRRCTSCARGWARRAHSFWGCAFADDVRYEHTHRHTHTHTEMIVLAAVVIAVLQVPFAPLRGDTQSPRRVSVNHCALVQPDWWIGIVVLSSGQGWGLRGAPPPPHYIHPCCTLL